jgi:uncharacterized protein YbjT (DUF2867 family)
VTARAGDRRILLTGATGYIGGRLLPALEARGERVRCLARNPAYLEERVADSTEVVTGDLMDSSSLESAMQGVDVAFYLVHSMASGEAFQDVDRRAAENFAAAASGAGVSRIVYLGGLGSGEGLSPHLASRQEVGEILRSAEIPVVELRASIVIGSGSLSFEMIRALVDRLPVMITPRWVGVKAQPIGIEDIVAYLVEAIDVYAPEGRVFEIGGPDTASYREIMLEYARQRGLRRLMIPVPVLTPRLSSLWLGLVTPVYARVGRKLIDSLRNETTVKDTAAQEAFSVRPRNLHDAIQRALVNEDEEFARTRWCDALSSKGETRDFGGQRFGTRLVDSRVADVDASPEATFACVEAIGGDTGWYRYDLLWRLRGLLDLFVGGPGLRRGRRDPHHVKVGDALDFWRVEAVEHPSLLRLSAEMKLPGRAWLQFEVEAREGGSTLRQTAIFDPVGLTGLLYWYALYPAHSMVFGGMIKAIAATASRGAMREA